MKIVKGVKGFVCQPVEERFWPKVDKRGENECWIWRGSAANEHGYGNISINGRARRVSQVSWEIHHKKPFPEGMMACHSCDNTRCVNPRHIWPGTMSENIKDAVNKGRLKTNPPINPVLTHCKRGHEFTPENTAPNTAGRRSCRTCKREWERSNRNGKRNRTA